MVKKIENHSLTGSYPNLCYNEVCYKGTAFYLLLTINELFFRCREFISARIFFLVDIWEFFSDFGLGGRKKKEKKALKMTSSLVIFKALFFQSFFFNIFRKKQ